LTQKDYYSLMAFFNNLPETGVPSDTIGTYYVAKPWIFDGSNADLAKLKAMQASVAEARKANEKDPKLKDIQKKLDEFEATFPRVMVMADTQPRKSHVLSRGNYEAPLAE